LYGQINQVRNKKREMENDTEKALERKRETRKIHRNERLNGEMKKGESKER
jgi:hypothetical protein